MSRNFRCTVGMAIIWGLFMLNIIWGFFVVSELFFGGLIDMYNGMQQVGWDVQFTYGIAKVFCSGVGALSCFWIAVQLLSARDSLAAWGAGRT